MFMSTIFRLRVGARVADRQEKQMQLTAPRFVSCVVALGWVVR